MVVCNEFYEWPALFRVLSFRPDQWGLRKEHFIHYHLTTWEDDRCWVAGISSTVRKCIETKSDFWQWQHNQIQNCTFCRATQKRQCGPHYFPPLILTIIFVEDLLHVFNQFAFSQVQKWIRDHFSPNLLYFYIFVGCLESQKNYLKILQQHWFSNSEEFDARFA